MEAGEENNYCYLSQQLAKMKKSKYQNQIFNKLLVQLKLNMKCNPYSEQVVQFSVHATYYTRTTPNHELISVFVGSIIGQVRYNISLKSIGLANFCSILQ